MLGVNDVSCETFTTQDAQQLVAAQPGLRVPGTWDPYETGVRAIVGQQVSVAGASTVTARIVQRAGTPLSRPSGSLTHAFPAPEVLAGADLSGIGMPGSRVAAIQAFAAAVAGALLRRRATVERRVRVAWVLYLILACSLTRLVWSNDWAFLRALSELYVMGVLILLSTVPSRPAPAA